eukprot:6691790-Heterocapsa_arctica.AAC.1
MLRVGATICSSEPAPTLRALANPRPVMPHASMPRGSPSSTMRSSPRPPEGCGANSRKQG